VFQNARQFPAIGMYRKIARNTSVSTTSVYSYQTG
jgi:hypothetical protein